MPYPKKKHDEDDPEERAERELDAKIAELGLGNGTPKATAKKLPAAPQPSLIESVAKVQKEAKAIRKKRARGVSGSSIKKDGGRFDMGLDDYDLNGDFEGLNDDVEVAYDEYQRFPRNIGPNSGYPCSDSLNAKSKRDSVLRLKDAVLTAISPEQDGYAEIAFLNMLTEEYDEVARVRLLHEVVSAICKEKVLIVAEPESEYRLTVIIARLMNQGLIKSATVTEYLESNMDYKDHGWQILNVAAANSSANGKNLFDAKKCLEKLAKELVTEYDTKEVAADLSACNAPFYHANFVCQVCTEAINSMHMNVIYFVCTAFKDLLDHNTIDSWSVDIGFLRFFKSISTLEVDLPCATSLATMLMSYALVDLQIIDANTAVTCPKPRRFIKADSQGKLYATDGVSEPECSEINYFTYDLPDSTM